MQDSIDEANPFWILSGDVTTKNAYWFMRHAYCCSPVMKAVAVRTGQHPSQPSPTHLLSACQSTTAFRARDAGRTTSGLQWWRSRIRSSRRGRRPDKGGALGLGLKRRCGQASVPSISQGHFCLQDEVPLPRDLGQQPQGIIAMLGLRRFRRLHMTAPPAAS